MKKVVIFDTSIGSLNMGDEIINRSIKKNWKELYKDNYTIIMPSHTPTFHGWQNLIMKRNKAYSDVDFKFICGTNLLYTNMLRPEPNWNIFLHNTKNVRGTICIGVGIGKNSKRVNLYTRALYKKVLNKEFVHSVRDDAALKLLQDLGFKAVNTGCPTLWGLTPEFCKTIPTKKSNRAIFTLTCYHADIEKDKKMVEIIKKNYEEVYFWPQTMSDLDYIHSLGVAEGVNVVAPNVESYDEILSAGDIDYIGNRLHGGIFSLQHARRTIIIGIDYRVDEMKKTFSIPSMKRENMEELDGLINSEWQTEINGIDFEAIEKWKAQFKF
ncbi:MAG: polysaccharide pyruvyl transferase family protein [Clostridia bacterium]|nr:polysaccharide pyruvyl transferase family protein [Clostridia bacterium]